MPPFLAAAMIWIFNFLAVLYICWLYGRMRAIQSVWPVVVGLSLVMGGGELWLATINPTISCFLPTAIGMGLVFVVSKIPKYKQRWYNTDSPIMMRLNQTERAPLNDTPAKVTSGRTMSFNQAFFAILSVDWHYRIMLVSATDLQCSQCLESGAHVS